MGSRSHAVPLLAADGVCRRRSHDPKVSVFGDRVPAWQRPSCRHRRNRGKSSRSDGAPRPSVSRATRTMLRAGGGAPGSGDSARETPVTSEPTAPVALAGGLPARIRTPGGTPTVRAQSSRFAREAIIGACPPIATAFNPSWMLFRTLRCRWPFPFLRNWVSRKSSMTILRPSWIWHVRNLATMSPWKKSDAGLGCDPPCSFSPCRGARSGASGSRRPGTDRCGPGPFRRDRPRRREVPQRPSR